MRLSWNGLQRGWLVACSVGLSCLISCGGKEFASGNSGSGGSSGGDESGGKSNGGSNSGANGGSSMAGDEALGGSPDPGGSSGAGGGVTPGCSCEAGHYCRDGSKDCFDCAELSRLRFTAPERLDTVSGDNQASRFPRVGESSSDLLYSLTGAGMRYTSDSSTSAGAPVAMTQAQDNAPLLLAENVTSLMAEGDFNFAFDRLEAANHRQLFFGQWQGGLAAIGLAPAPYNGGTNDFSIAIAPNPTADGIARAYWMTDRDPVLGIALVTALLAVNAPGGGPVALAVGQNGCTPEKADLTPWVTPDGKTLLFSHTRVDGNCTTTNQGKDIYTALLQPTTGQPTAAAVPLPDVNGASNDVDPSFSADFCDLYFASDRDGGYALYRAHRR